MIKSRVPSQQYKDNYDKVFRKESKSVQKRKAEQSRSARCPAPQGK